MIRSNPSLLSLISSVLILGTLFQHAFANKPKKTRILSNIMKGDSIHEDCPHHTNSSTAHGRREAVFKQSNIRQYEPYSYGAIVDALHELEEDFPHLVTLNSAQELYGLHVTGDENDCPMDSREGSYNIPGCKNWILTIQDELAYPISKESQPLPEVFLSGALHGDEIMGPVAAIEFAALLLDAASCESLPRDTAPSDDIGGYVEQKYKEEIMTAITCRMHLHNKGIGTYERKWLARLVATRRIIIVPTPNALGYYREERGENGLDPNRDFTFDAVNATCMQTVAARTINEIFRSHMISASITLHSGTESIGYPWASPDVTEKVTPDTASQEQIAQGLSKFGGTTFFGYKELKTGRLRDLLNPFKGGMTDWAYAASWDKPYTAKCVDVKDPINGKYDMAKTVYDDHTNRAMSFLASSSHSRGSSASHFGTDLNLFNPHGKQSGHISRFLRILAMITDIVEPYVRFQLVNGVNIADDIIPLRKKSFRSCMDTKAFRVPNGKPVELNYNVGGAFTVDRTIVMHVKWEDLPESFDGCSRLELGEERDFFMKVINDEDIESPISSSFSGGGKTQWHNAGPTPTTTKHPRGNSFSKSVSLKNYKEGDKVAVFAIAQVDQSWDKVETADDVKTPPQTHLVNWRLNTDDKAPQNRASLYWFSVPVTLVIGPGGSKTVEMSSRFRRQTFIKKVETEVGQELSSHGGHFFIAGTMCFLIAGFMYYEKNRKDNFGRRIDTPEHVHETKKVEEEEYAFDIDEYEDL